MASQNNSASASSGVDPTLASQLRKRSQSQLKTIQMACAQSLELQSLVLATITDYERTAKMASDAGVSVSALAMKKQKTGSSSAADIAAVAAPDSVSDPATKLGKARTKLSGWSQKWLQELLTFVAPQARVSKANLGRKPLLQIIEFASWLLPEAALGLATKSKETCFRQLRNLAQRKGLERVMALLPINGDTGVDWAAGGHYILRGGALVCTAIPGSPQMPMNADSLGVAADAGQLLLQDNFSITACKIVYLTSGESWEARLFFPSLRRSLQCRLSETGGAGPALPPLALPVSEQELAEADGNADMGEEEGEGDQQEIDEEPPVQEG